MIAERKCEMVAEITRFLYKVTKPDRFRRFSSKAGMLSTLLTQAEVRYILRAFFRSMNDHAPQHKRIMLRYFDQYNLPIRRIDGSVYRIGYRIENIPCVVFNAAVGDRSFTEKHHMGLYRADTDVPYTLINRLYSMYKEREASYEKDK